MTKLSALFSFLSVFAITSMASADTLTISTDRTSYVPGQVMKITALYKKNDGKPITSPNTREVQIKNPSGSELLKTSMKNAGSGVYTYAYTFSKSATSGKYEVSGKFVYNGVETKAYTYPQVITATTDTTPPLTSVSPSSGTYTMPINVTLAANESATIYYTVNGSTPTTASTRYTAPISLKATTTLKYFARDTAGNNEAVKTAIFTAGSITPPPPAGGHASLTYTDGAMCLQCHATQAAGIAGSTHYRWEGAYSQISNKPGVTGGKLNSSINAYCINTLGNWNGCGGCHIGAGAKPVRLLKPLRTLTAWSATRKSTSGYATQPPGCSSLT